MTKPQQRMMERLEQDPVLIVSGSSLRTAQALERQGRVQIAIGGSGVAYKAPWWWEVRAIHRGPRHDYQAVGEVVQGEENTYECTRCGRRITLQTVAYGTEQ